MLTCFLSISQNETGYEDTIEEKAAKSQIQKTFDSYIVALKTKNIDAIEKYYSQKTIKYLEGIFYKIKTVDSTSLEELNYFDKFYILKIRHLFSRKDIMSKERIDLLKNYPIEVLPTREDIHISAGYISLGIHNNEAKVLLAFNDFTSESSLNFIKEGEEWKVDIMNHLRGIAFQMRFSNERKEENDFLLKQLYQLDGKVPKKSIWLPIKQ